MLYVAEERKPEIRLNGKNLFLLNYADLVLISASQEHLQEWVDRKQPANWFPDFQFAETNLPKTILARQNDFPAQNMKLPNNFEWHEWMNEQEN